jgi:hypothetical protein
MPLATATRHLRRVPTILLLICALALAISSFALDEIRIAEQQAALSHGNTVQIHRGLSSIALPLGLGSMALCGIAWWNSKHRVLVGCAAVLLAPIALHLYSVYIFVGVILAMLGIYKGPLP